jgi:hypothetical protein
MNNKTLAIILVVFGGLILFSEQEGSWWVSAIFVGVGSVIIIPKNLLISLLETHL